MTLPLVRTGVDLVSVARLQHLLAVVGEPFSRKTWTTQEVTDCAGRTESLAARWAAKEATLKALGVGVGEIPMTDIEIYSQQSGAPELALSGRAAAAGRDAGLNCWSVSLSHDSGLAIAFVIGLGA